MKSPVVSVRLEASWWQPLPAQATWGRSEVCHGARQKQEECALRPGLGGG